MLNNICYVVDFDSSLLNIYKNHKLMIRIRIPQYSPGGCGFAVLAVIVFFFILNSIKTKFRWMIRITRIIYEYYMPHIYKYYKYFLNLWIWMSRRMNESYFNCYEFDNIIVLVLIATCTYKSMLSTVRMSLSNWISILLTH